MFGLSTLMINSKLLDNNNENNNLIDPLLSFDFWRNCHIIGSSQINKKITLELFVLIVQV